MCILCGKIHTKTHNKIKCESLGLTSHSLCVDLTLLSGPSIRVCDVHGYSHVEETSAHSLRKTALYPNYVEHPPHKGWFFGSYFLVFRPALNATIWGNQGRSPVEISPCLLVSVANWISAKRAVNGKREFIIWIHRKWTRSQNCSSTWTISVTLSYSVF